MKTFYKFWHYLTAYIPRRLPKTEAEWDAFRDVLVTYYGVPDTLETWIAVAAQIGSVPHYKLRRSYGYFANCGKRLETNKIIQAEKLKMMKVLNERFRQVAEEEKKKLEAEKTVGDVIAEELAKTDTAGEPVWGKAPTLSLGSKELELTDEEKNACLALKGPRLTGSQN